MAERVLVIGATSRVAQEIVKLHAARGDELTLVGRDRNKLEEIEKVVGRPCALHAFDFRDLASIEERVRELCDHRGVPDRVFVAHGHLGDQEKTEASFVEALETLEVNFTSVLAFVIPLANRLEERKSGRLCVIGSVAGERGRPRNYTYAAAKAGVHIFLEGLRSRLYRTDVSVTTIKLGPVDTPMTRDHEKNFLFSSPESVASAIVRAVDGKKGNVFVPGYFRLVLWVVKGLPEALFQKIPSLSGR